MSGRPGDNVAAATCVIKLKTTDWPAAPTLLSTRQRDEREREFSHDTFKQDI